MGVAPDDQRRKFTADKFVPLHYGPDKILYLSGNRKNGIDKPHAFKSKREAEKAIRRSITFFKPHHKNNPYKIVPLTIV